MNDVHSNKLAMLRKVLFFAANNASALSSIPKVALTAAQLQEIVDAIEQADINATADNSGYAEAKAAQRQQVQLYCRRISRSLAVHALEANDFVLKRVVKFAPSEFDSMREGQLLETAKMLHGKALPLIEDLQGITAADLEAMDGITEQFETAMPAPREKIGESSAYAAHRDELFAEGDKIMDKLRTYMGLFEDTERILYDEFLAAASIDDLGGGSSQNISDAVDANSNKKVQTFEYDAAKVFMFENMGVAALEIVQKMNGTATGDPVTVLPGASVTKTYGDMGATGNQLWVHNTDTANPGSYKLSFPSGE